MADIQVPSIAVATPAAADTVLGVQGGAVKRFVVNALPFTQAGTGAVARTALAKLKESVSPEDFGAVGDGISDDSAAWITALAAIADGGSLWCRAGATYLFSSQVTVTGPAFNRIVIHGNGAVIKTSGAISGLKLTGGSTTGGVTINQLKIEHRGNADATYGFEIIQSWYARLNDCFVEAHGVGASYAAFYLGNGTAADDSTGTFWTELRGCGCRKRSGTDVGDIPVGVLLQGASNSTSIIAGSYANVATGVKVTTYSGRTYVANALLIMGVAFEGFTTGVHVDGAITSYINGHRFVGNRFENGLVAFSYTTTTTQPLAPPFACGNFLVSNVTTYLNNPGALVFNSIDMGLSPDLFASGAWKIQANMDVTATSGSHHAFVARVTGGNRGAVLYGGGAPVAYLTWSGSGVKAKLRGAAASLALEGIQTISATSTPGNNLRGQATLAGGTAVVAFGTAEPDASYHLSLAGDASEAFSWSNKGTAGFTITSSNVSSTAKVDWILIR